MFLSSALAIGCKAGSFFQMAVKGAAGFSALFSDSIFFCEFVERTLMIEVQYDLFLQQSLVIFRKVQSATNQRRRNEYIKL